MLQRDHIYALSSKPRRRLHIEMHHKQAAYVVTRKPIYSLLVCKFDTMWLSSTRRQKIRAAATTTAWHDNLMDTNADFEAAGVGYKVGKRGAIVWPYVKRSSVYPSLWALSQASRQGLLRRRPLGARPCPVTTGRDGQIIMETSWGQEIGFPFQSGRWGEFAVSHHNRLPAIDWSPACLKKDSFNCSCRRKQMPELFAFRKKAPLWEMTVLF